MRYFVGVYEVAGYFHALAKGLRANGFEADFYLDSQTDFGYDCDSNKFNKAFLVLTRITGVLSKAKLVFLARLLLRAWLLIYGMFKYDVFIFSGFGSFFGFRELPLLRFLNKTVIVIYLGSDSRPSMFSGGFLDLPLLPNTPECNIQRTKRQKAAIGRVENNGCIVVNHTASSALFKKSFVPLLSIGIPVDLAVSKCDLQGIKSREEFGQDQTLKVRIVHAPSRPLAKGSPILLAEIERIQAEVKRDGIEVELVSLIGVNNETVLREIENADLVVNELYSDTYMSVLDAEAAMYGKPSLKFGYYASRIVQDNPKAQHPEYILYWSPDQMRETLKKYVCNAGLRRLHGQAQAKFLEECWNGKAVAARLNQLVEDPLFRRNCLVEPDDFDYHFGWGLTKNSWLKQVEPCLKFEEFRELFSLKHLKQITDECTCLKKKLCGSNGST